MSSKYSITTKLLYCCIVFYICVCLIVIVSLLFSQEEEHQEKLRCQRKKQWPMAHKIYRMGKVVLVSKKPFSLNLLPLCGPVWWYVDNHGICSLPCSNYDKKYYHL